MINVIGIFILVIGIVLLVIFFCGIDISQPIRMDLNDPYRYYDKIRRQDRASVWLIFSFSIAITLGILILGLNNT